MSDYKIYYGEYTLKHWIKLLLKRDITLPPYQRPFVWKEKNVIGLANSLKNGLFVPPVTIGAYKKDGKWHNYILDGQQRLTSILLAYIDQFPKKEKFKPTENNQLANDNDDNQDDTPNDVLEWNLSKITNVATKKENREDIKSSLIGDDYKKFDPPTKKHGENITAIEALEDAFFENTFLGFSFIKPSTDNHEEQTKYYSTLFRSINTSAMELSAIESRSSLYWLDESLAGFFKPLFFNDLEISNSKVDFVRCAALLSEYHKKKQTAEPSTTNIEVARGYSGRRQSEPLEVYIENYIYHVIGKAPSETFTDFSSFFADRNFSSQMTNLQSQMQALNTKKFSSIIDADYYLFGLIYYALFNKKIIDSTRIDNLKKELTTTINTAKGDSNHVKQPAAQKWLRKRLNESISIYSKYIQV